MKKKHIIKIAVIAALTVTTAFLCSCDNPLSMARLNLHLAKDSLEAGNPYAAQELLKRVGKGLDSRLDCEIDSLRLIIEKAIEEEDKKTGKDSLIIK
ncbi:MAG: hypothetical protein J6W03_09485 [Bacteroidaceae bacterium]|nr:hypothetical protein [Bacteroidaceae bacterium]